MKKALVVVDMQNDFITGSLENDDAKNIVGNVVDLINMFKNDVSEDEGTIFVTMDTHHEDYLNTFEGKNLPVKHCIEGTNGWQLNANIQCALDDLKNVIILKKETFGSEDLPNVLRLSGKYDEIIMCGLCTDICVVTNALLLRTAFPNTKISIFEQCCAGTSTSRHNAAIETMKSCQINIA